MAMLSNYQQGADVGLSDYDHLSKLHISGGFIGILEECLLSLRTF